MGDLSGGALGAAISAPLGLYGQFMSQQGQSDANAQNNQEQINLMNNANMMSNTAYTRATADMKNAGLNPALMYGSGSAASTPSTGSIPMQNTQAGWGQAFNNSAQTAIQAVQAGNDATLKAAQTTQALAQSKAATSSASQADESTNFMKLQENQKKAEGKIYDNVSSGMDYINNLLGSIKGYQPGPSTPSGYRANSHGGYSPIIPPNSGLPDTLPSSSFNPMNP